MLYNDFMKARVTIGELQLIQTTAENNGLEMTEVNGTFALIDSNNKVIAEGYNEITSWLGATQKKAI